MLPPEAKAVLRRRVRTRLRDCGHGQLERESASICSQLLSRNPSPAHVLAYWPLASEPDIRPALRTWLSGGCHISLPLVEGEGLSAREISDFDALIRGDLGVREPDPARCPASQLKTVDLIIVPGVAFASNGDRLGRGGGYYDRFLAAIPTEIPRIGVAFACQIFDVIPTEPHDWQLSAVITTRR